MALEIKNVLVLGATGNLGPVVVSSLVKAGFSVSALSRNPTSAPKFEQNVIVRKSDYTFASLVEVFSGQDAVVSTISTDDIDLQRNIIDAAVTAKVKRFLPSEFGGDSDSKDPLSLPIFAIPKQKAVEYLRTKETEGLSWTALCAGSWIDWALEMGDGYLGWDLKSKSGKIFDSGDQEFDATTLRQVGKAVAAVLQHTAETKDRYIYVHSFVLTQNRLLSAIERVSGQKIFMTTGTVAELKTNSTKLLAQSDQRKGYLQLITSVVHSGSTFSLFSKHAEHGNKILGLEQEDLDLMIERVLKKVGTT